MAGDDAFLGLLNQAAPASMWSTESAPLTAGTLRAMMEKVRDQPYVPDERPPISPALYRWALEQLGLPADHRLTRTEFDAAITSAQTGGR